MQSFKKGLLPFRHGVFLSDDQRPKTLEEEDTMRQVSYASAMGSLMYAMLCTRPDICYSVGRSADIRGGKWVCLGGFGVGI